MQPKTKADHLRVGENSIFGEKDKNIEKSIRKKHSIHFQMNGSFDPQNEPNDYKRRKWVNGDFFLCKMDQSSEKFENIWPLGGGGLPEPLSW